MFLYGSKPGVSKGARPAIDAVARTRSPSSAAQASACGPPPEGPITAKRSRPKASATASASVGAEAIVRPGCRVEPP